MTEEIRVRGLHYHQWMEDTDGVPFGVEVLAYDGTNQSMQAGSFMLGLTAGVGSNTNTSPKYLAALMAEIHGGNDVGDTVNLSRTDNMIAAIVAKYSHIGTSAATYANAALRAEIGSETTAARAAVLAVMSGDSGTTSAEAAFGVDWNASTIASRFNTGLDLEGLAAHDSYQIPRYNQSFIRMGGRVQNAAGDVVTVNDIVILAGTAAPTDGASGTGVNVAGPGSLYIRQSGTDSKIFIMTAAASSSVTWVAVGGQS